MTKQPTTKSASTGAFGEYYAGAIATPHLVGRDQVLNEINRVVSTTANSVIIDIVGEGGIGKTRLVQYILENPPEGDLLVANQLVDLYHASNYSVDGLLHNIQLVLAPDGVGFEEYLKERATLNEYLTIRPAESAEVFRHQRISMREAFIKELNELADKRRVVFVLDTAEKLFYQADPVAERLGLSRERPPVLNWLTDYFFPRLRNTVAILARRPGPVELAPTLSKFEEVDFYPVQLQGLDEKESLAYFEAVLARARRGKDSPQNRAVIQAISALDEEHRRVIFYSLCSGSDRLTARPILLALAIDHMVVSGRPLEAFSLPLAEAQALTPAQRRDNQDKLGRALVHTLKEEHRPADEIVVTLGWLRKGVDAVLLARLTERDQAEVERILAQITNLSFVKIRPADERIFLHDELYDMLQKYALEVIPEARKEKIFTTLRQYYDEQIDHIRDDIDKLYVPLAESPKNILPEPDEVIETRTRLQNAIIEDLHYRLRWKADQGFQVYYRYSEEAVISDDESLGAQLRAELQAFLAEQDPEGQQAVIDGLARADVEADAAIRRVEWLWVDNKLEDARELLNRLEQEHRPLIEAGGDLARAELNVWKAILAGYRGEYKPGIDLSNEAVDLLLKYSQARRSIRWAGILAAAYNTLGYLYRLQAKPHDAIVAYQKALPLWRAARFEARQAGTLNNLAFASALIGDFTTAEQHARDALHLRERLGPRDPVGLSLNTLALIEIRRGHLDRGLRQARRAFQLFNVLNYERGRGLALIARAEARRRMSDTISARQEKQMAAWLAKAAGYAQEAAKIFQDREPSHQVEALIELGCAYRDWARLRRDDQSALAPEEETTGHTYLVEELAHRSRDALQKAAGVAAAKEDPFLEIDARLNIAWLEYYTSLYVDAPGFEEKQAHLENSLLRPLEEAILAHYPTVNDVIDLLPKDAPSDRFLIHLGKLEILRGQVALNRFTQSGDRDTVALVEAARHYTYGLIFHDRYSIHTFFELRRDTGRLYERLSKLNAKNLNLVYETVHALEEEYNLGQTEMSRFLESRFGPAEALIPLEL